MDDRTWGLQDSRVFWHSSGVLRSSFAQCAERKSGLFFKSKKDFWFGCVCFLHISFPEQNLRSHVMVLQVGRSQSTLIFPFLNHRFSFVNRNASICWFHRLKRSDLVWYDYNIADLQHVVANMKQQENKFCLCMCVFLLQSTFNCLVSSSPWLLSRSWGFAKLGNIVVEVGQCFPVLIAAQETHIAELKFCFLQTKKNVIKSKLTLLLSRCKLAMQTYVALFSHRGNNVSVVLLPS